jgi:predicted dehydrogenase
VVAIADLFQDRIDRQLKWLQDNGKPAPRKTFAGPESWKRVCEMDDVDVVYNVTPWHLHEPIASYAMEHGKVALNEVPGCLSIDECWKLVETSERTRMPCMMLENCCYGEYEMAMFNMVKQGVFGEIVHGEAG